MKFKQVFCGVILAAIVLSVLLMFPVKASAASGDIGPNLRYTFSSSSGTLTISGTGEFYKMSVMSPPYNGYWSFNNKIRKVVIKEGATKIPAGLFSSCSNLESVSLPESITSIDYNAFLGCKKLKTINIPKNLTFLGKNAFNGCALTKVHLPEGITEIKERTFAGCDKLQEVTISGNLTKIGDGAFVSCKSLTTVTFSGGSVDTIGEQAFAHCESLKNMDFPEGLTAIRGQAFSECISLESIDLPEGLKSLWSSAFYGCDGLTTVTIPRSVNYMESHVFVFCDNLQSATMYSETVSSIPKAQFGGNDNFRYVHVIGDAPTPKVKNVFGNFDADEDFVVYYDPGTAGWQEPVWQEYWLEPWGGAVEGIQSGSCGENAFWTLENGVLTISGTGDMASYEREGYANQVPPWFRSKESIHTLVIEEGITRIGSCAFYNMDSLVDVTIPDTVTEILTEAFYDCDGISEVTIPANVTRLEFKAFGSCNGLQTIRFQGSVPIFGQSAFSDVTATIYYPADDPTWTDEIRQQFLGTITWVPYDGEIPEEPEAIPGDINGDGKVNNKDASCLFQYLSGWDVEVNEARLDVNGDSKVNNKDASLLFQYLSGWDVEIR